MWYTITQANTPLHSTAHGGRAGDARSGPPIDEGFTVRRGQLLLGKVEGQRTPTIARTLRCHEQTVRNAIHVFHQRGGAALQPSSSRPHRTQAAFDADGRERLRALLHRSPRTFGKPTSRWTLALASEVSCAQGRTRHQVSG